MAENNRRTMILIMILVAILLIVGAWFLFNKFALKENEAIKNENTAKAAKILKIKNLAQENLGFFPTDKQQEDILEKLESHPQYTNLHLDLDTSIDIKNNLGNRYPFSSPVTETVPTQN